MELTDESDQDLDVGQSLNLLPLAWKDHKTEFYKRISIGKSSNPDQDLNITYTNHIEKIYKRKSQNDVQDDTIQDLSTQPIESDCEFKR